MAYEQFGIHPVPTVIEKLLQVCDDKQLPELSKPLPYRPKTLECAHFDPSSEYGKICFVLIEKKKNT